MGIEVASAAPIVAAAVAVQAPNAAVAAVLAGQSAAVVGAAIGAVQLPETGIAPQVAVAATVPADTTVAPDATPAEPVAPAVPPTRAEVLATKLAAKQAQYVKLADEIAKLEQQYRAVDLLDSVKEGSVIVAKVGRAETAKEVEAAVIGVQTLENGDRRLKIYFGTGFEAETVIIQDSQIIDVKQA